MPYIRTLIVKNTVSVKEAMRILDENTEKILFIINTENELVGALTDGDIRRWILKNGSLEKSIENAMNRQPIFLYEKEKESAYSYMQEKMIEALPILDDKNCIIDILFWNNFFDSKMVKYGEVNIPVVIMAGGQGSRLYPYTKILPKPLIPIGDTPIVERIIEKFVSFGCQKFYVTVNYKKNMIKSYFADAEKQYDIAYIEEERPLGTGGSLYFLREEIKGSFFLSNCDVLVEADYASIYNYHKDNQNQITMVTSLKKNIIPYGVVHINENSQITHIVEKPESHFLVNTGMYIIESKLLDRIPRNTFYHITELIDECIREGIKIGTYPVSEGAWLDMGQFSEMERMLEALGING